MFKEAVSKVRDFTRPIMFISRNYNSKTVIPGLATLFFVNDSGCAITCKHVAELILQTNQINENYNHFREEVTSAKVSNPHNYKKEVRILERKYNIQHGTTINAEFHFLDVPTPGGEITVHMHPTHDLAIVQFQNFDTLNYCSENIFLLKDEEDIQPGRSLCRLGYPFPEFTNFKHNEDLDTIEWTDAPPNVPSFPIDGIITRHLGDEAGNIFGIELSTPGLRGQSGGPLFDTQGRIYGMQFATNHLHLGFDMERQPMNLNGEMKIVNNQPFLHVGHCIHVSIIKEFLNEHQIAYKMA